jgi:hypothetical protein
VISCTTFRTTFAPATDDAELLEHIRSCDACLDHAASVDPDILFRAIGGAEMIPPGGVEAFAADVMREVRLRSTEQSIHAHRALAWPQRLAIAATLAAGVIGGALFYGHGRGAAPVPMAPAAALRAPQLTTKPVVETYDSATATIVEVPTEGASDVKVVMVFDEQLPADL